MANICDNTFKIVGPVDEINGLFSKLRMWRDTTSDGYKKYAKTQHYRTTPGAFHYIALQAGLDTKKYGMRGSIYFVDDVDSVDNEACLSFDAESAWDAPVSFVEDLVKKLAPHCRICYKAEEPGTDYYIIGGDINGKYFPEDFVFDSDVSRHKGIFSAFNLPMQDVMYYTEEDFLKILRDGFHEPKKSLDELLEEFTSLVNDSLDEDEFIRIGRFNRI